MILFSFDGNEIYYISRTSKTNRNTYIGGTPDLVGQPLSPNLGWHPIHNGFILLDDRITADALSLALPTFSTPKLLGHTQLKEIAVDGFLLTPTSVNTIHLFNLNNRPLKEPIIHRTKIILGQPFIIAQTASQAGIVKPFYQDGLDGMLTFFRALLPKHSTLWKISLNDLPEQGEMLNDPSNRPMWVQIPTREEPVVKTFTLDNTPTATIENLISRVPFNQRDLEGNPL